MAEGLLERAQDSSGTVNSAATRDNREIEDIALAIVQTEAFAKGREQASFMWRSIVGSDPDERAWSRFDGMIEEYGFNAALKAANGDPNHPRVLSVIYGAPHAWFGRTVPGSRLAGDNPDNQYSLIPVDDRACYEIRGQRIDPSPADVNFTLMGNTTLSKTLASIEGRDLVVDSVGSFVVTVGPEDAGGRPNHLRTRPGAKFVFIRESRSDWQQRPARMAVTRLDPPAAPPRSFEAMVDSAVEIMVDDVPNSYWWMRLSLALAPNTMRPPFKTAAVGGLHSQQVSFGHVLLGDDDAFVITVEPGGAGFRNLVLHDYWYRTMDVAERMSCLNSGQAAPDDDGRFTYVVAHRDPGIHNWLDPEGQAELLLVHRWQNLPREPGEREPAISGRIVRFADLERALPVGVRRIDGAQRAEQLRERAAQFNQRFSEA